MPEKEKIKEKNLEQASLAQNDSPELLPLLPLKNVILLPKSVIPIIAGRPLSIRAVEAALKNDRTIFITAQKDAEVENPSLDDLFLWGTKAQILQVMRMPNGSLKILAEAIGRAKITAIESDDNNFMNVSFQEQETIVTENHVELQAMWRQLHELYQSYAKLNEKAPSDLTEHVKTTEDMDHIADTIAVHINNLSFHDRQEILELADLQARMLKICSCLKKEIDILQAEQRIRGRIQTQVEKNQREFYLTEQMKAIQKELGREDQSSEIEQLRTHAKKIGLPEFVFEKVEKELRRLEQMPPFSSEAAVSRHYVDWITSLPWNKVTKDKISLKQAESILNDSHAGLKKAKERIIEFLAAKKFSKFLKRSPIICLAGPPGVGKTSLGQSIAQSLGREFVRISLGGLRDEAEIRGHRRTYIGALPGKIIQAVKKANVQNPVILLDEIDKMSRDMHGDPAAALLEVLDPEQNKSFTDHFLDTEYDLSQVMFIATANVLEHIPYPLFDRLEIINLSGYTEEDKLSIAKQFLIPKQLKEHGLTATQCKLSDEVVKLIINEYTKEAGVRQLERLITKIMRKTIQQLLHKKSTKNVVISPQLVKEWLGSVTFKKTSLNQNKERCGLTTGLAWTEVGGDVLEIETSVLPGKGTITLTGQLGEVMQESAQAALSYIRSRAALLGLKKSFYTDNDIHLHIPEGATPKDGPSAGITICTAVISALTKKSTPAHLAMTGEITLQGRVLSIGGLKEKLLAAKQHDMKTVIVPDENREDIEEIKKEITIDDLEIIFVKTMDDVLKIAFNSPFIAQKAPKKPASKKRAPTRRIKKKA